MIPGHAQPGDYKNGSDRTARYVRYASAFPRSLRIEEHLDAMGVVHDPVKDAAGQSGIAYLIMPARDWRLRSEDGRAYLAAIFAELPKVAALGF